MLTFTTGNMRLRERELHITKMNKIIYITSTSELFRKADRGQGQSTEREVKKGVAEGGGCKQTR